MTIQNATHHETAERRSVEHMPDADLHVTKGRPR
jgi:hypothetical protein